MIKPLGILAVNLFSLNLVDVVGFFDLRNGVVPRIGMGHVAGDHHLVVGDPCQYFRQMFLVAFAGEINLAVLKILRWRTLRQAGAVDGFFRMKVVIHALCICGAWPYFHNKMERLYQV